MYSIEIEKLTFGYDEKNIFENFNLKIKKGDFISIVGKSGTGKSSLVKILSGSLKFDGDIKIMGTNLNKETRNQILNKIGFVLENPELCLIHNIVLENLIFKLENLGLNKKEIDEKLDSIYKLIPIKHLINCKINTLSGGEKQLVALSSALINEPPILILDEAFIMLDLNTREKMLKLLKKISKQKKITIINITHDEEEIIYSDKVLILKDGKIVIFDKTKNVLQKENIFKLSGLSLPFMADLSNKLKYYNLIDDLIMNMDKLVDTLWK